MVNLNWPRPHFPHRGMTGPLVSGGCLLCELLGDCFFGEADPHQSRSAALSLAFLQRGLQGKSSQGLGGSAWLASGKSITCPPRGGRVLSLGPTPLGSTQTSQGQSSGSASVRLLLGPSSHKSPQQERNHPIVYLSFTWW